MLALERSTRADLWRELVGAIESSIEDSDELSGFAEDDAAELRAFLERLDFDTPLEPIEALWVAVEVSAATR
jgi:hypothetical protein